ncbi:MAG: hypothetical protein Q4G63_01035 [Bacteroidia bacterium]|nr:hypothetical protein [Bacteroidia bacterium]
MNQKIITFLIASLFAITLQAQQKVTVKVNYGDKKPTETFQVNWQEGMTALLAVQSCANVTTHSIKDYIFVRTINDISTVIGEKAWYYSVNNEKTGMLAFRYLLKPNDTIEWMYKKDVCSNKDQKQECEK